MTEIAASPLYMDVQLDPGASFSIDLPHDHTALAYLFEGSAQFDARPESIDAVMMVVYQAGDRIEIKSEAGARFMLIAGAPFREPIAPYGPFVMNTPAEIRQAIADLRNGTFVK